jgi:quinol monooxygenase YgiN
VLFNIHAAHFSQFMTAMVSNAEASLQIEPECHQLDVCKSQSNPEEVFYTRFTASK